MKVELYEVSHCDVSAGACDPGYEHQHGIQPLLEIYIALTYDGTTTEDHWAFVVPYDTIGWTETQWDLLGVTKG